MRILGIDTAIPTASVALIEDGALLAEARQDRAPNSAHRLNGKPPSNHAEAILPLIDSLFETAGITVSQLSGIAVSIGPGSFTGLRIGLATAKGLAYDSGLPLVGVSTLHANGARVSRYDAVIGSMLDARKGEVYFALFRRSQNTLTRLTCDAAMSIQSAIDLVQVNRPNPDSALILIGAGTTAHRRQLFDSFGTSAQVFAGSCYPSIASQVGMLAGERFVAGSFDDVGALAPVYLRLSEAESKRENLL